MKASAADYGLFYHSGTAVSQLEALVKLVLIYSFGMDHIENTLSSSFTVAVCVTRFPIAIGMCSLSCCLVMDIFPGIMSQL